MTYREVVTLSQAKQRGLTRYFTGNPCKRGHVSERHTSSRGCIECHNLTKREADRKYYRAHKDECNRRSKADYEANKEKYLRLSKEWNANMTPEQKAKQLKTQAKYRSRNRESEAQRARDYRKKHPHRVAEHCRNYQARKMERTPAWADQEAMRFFYECKPKGCHVDHIIPLQGKTVSGLHIEANLQWLPARLNIVKGNSFGDQP